MWKKKKSNKNQKLYQTGYVKLTSSEVFYAKLKFNKRWNKCWCCQHRGYFSKDFVNTDWGSELSSKWEIPTFSYLNVASKWMLAA